MMEQTINFEKTLKCNLNHCGLEKKELKAPFRLWKESL
jgi:hypothetical protein